MFWHVWFPLRASDVAPRAEEEHYFNSCVLNGHNLVGRRGFPVLYYKIFHDLPEDQQRENATTCFDRKESKRQIIRINQQATRRKPKTGTPRELVRSDCWGTQPGEKRVSRKPCRLGETAATAAIDHEGNPAFRAHQPPAAASSSALDRAVRGRRSRRARARRRGISGCGSWSCRGAPSPWALRMWILRLSGRVKVALQ